MKAFILAAGKGSRLKPLTDHIPKCLLSIGGYPVLQYWLEACKLHGIQEVLINLHCHAEKVVRFIQSKNWPIQIRLSYEPQLLGSEGTLIANKDFVEKEDFFGIFYADNLTNVDLTKMWTQHLQSKALFTMGLFHSPNPKECGIATLDPNNIITGFQEKPMKPTGDLANAGIYWTSPEIFDYCLDRVPCDIGYDLLPRLIGKMNGYVIEEYLLDIGTHQNYQRAQNDVKQLDFSTMFLEG